MRPNFDFGEESEIIHHSRKEHLKTSEIAKSGSKMFQNMENI